MLDEATLDVVTETKKACEEVFRERLLDGLACAYVATDAIAESFASKLGGVAGTAAQNVAIGSVVGALSALVRQMGLEPIESLGNKMLAERFARLSREGKVK